HHSNFELMVQLPANFPEIQEFETHLWHNTIQVDFQIYQQYLECVNQLKSQDFSLNLSPVQKQEVSSYEEWIPNLRNPEDLYLAYTEQWDKLTYGARELAAYDLQALPVIPDLEQTAFNAYVGILLLQKPVIQKVDQWVKTPHRFGAIRDLLASLPCAVTPNFNAERAWQTLMRWLLYFLPSRYALSVPNHSEIFYRINS
ncbi:hypothetical protein, partial [Planktothrix sp.]